MRTSELADRAGVNTETLRYYERRGLLSRAELDVHAIARSPRSASPPRSAGTP